jgi:acyl-CoA reductase-like NAD-dependent aldehyde dehydrogenase
MSQDPGFLHPTNPATGEPLEALACSSSEEVAAAVNRARAAAKAWAQLSVEERAAPLRRFAAKLGDEATAQRVAELVTTEMGKPISAARGELRTVATRVEGFISRAKDACVDEHLEEGKTAVRLEWRPLGVCAVVAPWNYPLSTPNSLVLSALLTGNTVVIKPSEITPRTGAAYHELLASELPEGVFEIVQGGGAVGAALVDADVDMVAFTGSIRTGQAIMRAAAGSMKRLVLELGGKDPMIILPGADLEAAADHAARESTRNSGQVCISVERVFVHESVADEFADMLEARVRAQEVGDPMLADTQIGPMANEQQRDHVLRQLEAAAAAGAEIRVQGESRGPGFFLTPSLALGVQDDMELASDETFGPVVCVSTYSEVDEVVERANATRYGLGASVWGPQGEQTEGVAAQIDAGMIGINRGLSAAGGAPWVGAKMSGFGYSRSREGMRQFMQPRTFSRRKA